MKIGFNKTLLFKSTQDYYIPVATYSPEQIFAGNVAGLDINFIKPNKYEKKDGTEVESSAEELRSTIAQWYVALRNLTVVGLLSVLVYVGIRIILSSTASDKAKYKQMLVDWLIALCLVFFLHYIMSFTLTMVDSITNAIAGDGEQTVVVTIKNVGSFKTNLLGLARFKTQYNDFGQKMAYLIMYLALVIYTIMFTWFYLKRLLMMAFLTLIAPVVALTYPIDKMNDGKAQAFNAWLKEYVFNALIQPFHLIIYTVMVGSAMEFAKDNIIYMIAALGFILPAEKILRKFFGFEKAGAGTLGALAGGFTAANLMKGLGKGKGGGGGKAPGMPKPPEGDKPPRFQNNDITRIGAGEASGESTPRENTEGVKGRNETLDNANTEGIASGNETLNNTNTEGVTSGNEVLNNNHGDGSINTTDTNAVTNEGANTEANNENRFKTGMQNLARYNGIKARRTMKKAAKLPGKAIKGTAKFATKTAFRAAAGALPAAVTLASGGGLAGASAAFMATSSVANSANEKLWGAIDNTPNMLREQRDVFNGNTNASDKAVQKAWIKDEKNRDAVREKLTKENGGKLPTEKDVKARMQEYKPYLEAGMDNVGEIEKARKAKAYVSDEQAALIAQIGKERNITADVLNDDKKATAAEANLRQEFINKKYSEADAKKQAHHTMQILKVQNNIANEYQKGKK